MLRKLLRRLLSKPYSPRRKNGQFIAHKEIPLHLRDLTAFEFWAYKKHKVKFETKAALINAFNKERIK